MEKKPPKRSLSLKTRKEQSQKKLTFTHQGKEIDSSSTNPAPDPTPDGAKQDEANPPPSVWLSGLCNLGNTCYANSILQVLRFCPQLSAKVTTLSKLLLQQQSALQVDAQGQGEETIPGEGCGEDWQSSKGALVIYLHKLWQRMVDKERISSNKSSVLSAARPQKFLTRLREEHEVFDNKMQQDAQEMLRFLLTSLHETVQLAFESLPDPATEGSRERPVVIPNDKISISQLSSRKRKLKQCREDGQKIAKTTGRRSTSASTKLTDFFTNSAAGSSSSNPSNPRLQVGVPEVEAEPQSGTGKQRFDFVKEMFQGELVSQTRCYECDNWTRRTEPFLDVSLAVSSHSLPGFHNCSTPIKDSNGGSHSRNIGKDLNGSTVVGPFSLSWAISQFCLREKLGGDNKYCCEQCGHLVEAERSVMFGHLPLVMTFHLNRFEMHCMYGGLYTGLSVNKIGGNISVPLTLCFSPWCTADCERQDVVYQLFAAVFHTGSSCSSGHYTVCVRGRECKAVGSHTAAEWIGDDRNWVDFDDEVVEVLNQQELMERLSPLTPSTAYILFYSAQ